jgi:hypothetical protein
VYIGLLLRKWRPESGGRALAMGVTWLVLTVAFEFLFGHYVAHHSWSRLLHDYNIVEGRIWLLVLVWITFAPLVFYRLRKM